MALLIIVVYHARASSREGGKRWCVSGARAPQLRRGDVTGAPERQLGEATSGGAGRDGKEGKTDRGERQEAGRETATRRGRQPRNRAFHLV